MNRETMNTTQTAEPAGAQKGMSDLFEHALRDMYYAEKKIYRTLPRMIRAAGDATLKRALTDHRDETMEHVETLETIFGQIGKKPKAVKCDAIDGILEEGDGLLEDFGGTEVADAAIIFSCQAVEHYEITRYGSMRAFALALGLPEAAGLIDGVLAQEKAADDLLSQVSESQMKMAA